MTIIQKIVKAGDLPPEWAKEFADPNVEVLVEIRSRPAKSGDRHSFRAGELSDEQITALQRDDIPGHTREFDRDLESVKQ